MTLAVPLRVTVEITLGGGDAAGERRFLLSRLLSLMPPRLSFERPLPLAGEVPGALRFVLPVAGDDAGRDDAGGWVASGETRLIVSEARLRFDPERPERGSEAELVGLSVENQQALERYFEQRMRS